MSQEQKSQEQKGRPFTKKQKVLAAAALTGFLGLSLATGYVVDSSRNAGYYRRSALDSVGFRHFKLQVDSPSKFPYQFSPWERYAQIEEGLLAEFNIPEAKIPRQTKRIISVANWISDNVAKRMLQAMDTYEVGDVSKVATSESLMNVIADEMANAGIFYARESFLSNSFNPKLHEKEDLIHLDCKLLTYLMCHIGRRLDLRTYIVDGPSHMYLFVESNQEKGTGYVIEPTQFRRIEETEDAINYAGKGIGDGFFTTFEKQKVHAGIVATERFIKAANLHFTLTDTRMIEDDMRANIIVGLLDYAKKEDDIGLKVRIYNRMFRMAQEGSGSYLVISNAFTTSLGLAEECVEKKRYPDAETLLKNAVWIRRERDELIVSKEPIEEILLGKLYWEMGSKTKALRQLREANELYKSRGLFYYRGNEDKPIALNRYHCVLLRYLAMAELDHGTMQLERIHNEILLPAYNHYANNQMTVPEMDKVKEMMDQVKARMEREGGGDSISDLRRLIEGLKGHQ
ncbi:Uncharacterised protein [uncultured archaeon]|nr:Uncharacterised protein [uncultured archaeon]